MLRRRLRLGLPTILGLTRRGYFIPYRYAAQLPAPGENRPYTALEDLLTAARPEMLSWLERLDGFAPDLTALGGAPPPEPRFDQDWFPTLDAAIAYTMVRTLRPARIVEIGSGHSTRFLARALRDEGAGGRLTAIDPAPRAVIEGLPIDIVGATVGTVDRGLFDSLAAGDILFVDSSHILMPGTDVDDVLNRILPRLPSGVIVHFHDIFLPDDYPRAWAWREYNEQGGVAPLLHCGAYAPLFASHFAASRMYERIADSVVARLPAKAGALPSSLWLRKG